VPSGVRTQQKLKQCASDLQDEHTANGKQQPCRQLIEQRCTDQIYEGNADKKEQQSKRAPSIDEPDHERDSNRDDSDRH